MDPGSSQKLDSERFRALAAKWAQEALRSSILSLFGIGVRDFCIETRTKLHPSLFWAPFGDWGTRFLQARAGKVVRLRGFAAAPRDFGTEGWRRGPAEEGVGRGGKPPPPGRTLNTPTRGSTDL